MTDSSGRRGERVSAGVLDEVMNARPLNSPGSPNMQTLFTAARGRGRRRRREAVDRIEHEYRRLWAASGQHHISGPLSGWWGTTDTSKERGTDD